MLVNSKGNFEKGVIREIASYKKVSANVGITNKSYSLLAGYKVNGKIDLVAGIGTRTKDFNKKYEAKAGISIRW